jgi:hypothetical protein
MSDFPMSDFPMSDVRCPMLQNLIFTSFNKQNNLSREVIITKQPHYLINKNYTESHREPQRTTEEIKN